MIKKPAFDSKGVETIAIFDFLVRSAGEEDFTLRVYDEDLTRETSDVTDSIKLLISSK
jgi:hypothetical protein